MRSSAVMRQTQASDSEQGGTGNHPALFASVRSAGRWLLPGLLLLADLFSATGALAQSTTVGTAIRNTAQVSFDVLGQTSTVTSNQASVIVEPTPSRSAISIARLALATDSASTANSALVGPTQCIAAGVVTPLAPPQVGGVAPINVAVPQALIATTTSHAGDAAFITVNDSDQNRDPNVRETVDVKVTARDTGDVETIRLTETGPNTGVFVGYIPTVLGSAANGDCRLQVARNALLDVSYVDPRDATDTSAANSLIDPLGVVFDSTTGQPVNGTRVSLVDAVTGAPAAVLGDDGVSRYPAVMITGTAVTDSGGTTYQYGPGVYRFPLVAPGAYRLVVQPPSGYQFASTAAIADLQRLSGAPFRLTAASFGGNFTANAPVATTVDVPIDPAGQNLTLAKSANVTAASVGDVIEYQLTLQNTSPRGAIRAIRITDVLPMGLSYRSGTVQRNHVAASDPLFGVAGRQLLFDLPTLAAGETLVIRYVAEVTVAAPRGKLTNTATAVASGGPHSNEARAVVTLREALFRDRGFILGRVFANSCDPGDSAALGVGNVRIYLEDGRYAVTDSGGRYHFEDVKAGTHVAQVDAETLPQQLQLAPCGSDSRRAGRLSSQFVELRPGALARADFALQDKPAPSGSVQLTVAPTLTDAVTLNEFRVQAQKLGVNAVRLLIQFPSSAKLLAVKLDGVAVPAAALNEGMLSVPLGDVAANEGRTLSVQTAEATQAPRAMLSFIAADRQVRHSETIAASADAAVSVQVPTQGLTPQSVPLPQSAPTASLHASVDSLTEEAASIDVEAIGPSASWLTPHDGATPAIASLKVAISHGPTQRVVLAINGSTVSGLNFDGVQLNHNKTAAISRWRGINLRDGDNRLDAKVLNADGSVYATLQRVVHYGGGAVRAELDREHSILSADGRTRPVIALRLFDTYGKPARRGTSGSLHIDSPYRSWWEVQANDDNPLLSQNSREPRFEVGDNGIALVELEPTTQAGFAVLHLRFTERRDQDVRVWLSPAARDWILVGLAAGTVARAHADAAAEPLPKSMADEPPLTANDTQTGGRVAFFAKGRVRGDFLLTLAYDSARDPVEARRRLQGVVEPDRYYLLYGDGTQQRNEASSSEKLFVRLERREFVALYGDFDTGMNVTELTRYSRSLTGLKTDVGGQSLGFSAFAARTDNANSRDELRGNGTSGPYALSRQDIVIGSDKLHLEVRDRLRIEQVLSTRELTRFTDYDIDYVAGTIRFKDPFAERDADFNPQYVIAEYETNGFGQQHTVAGARLTTQTANGNLEVGASAIVDGATAGQTRIEGVDLRWHPSPITLVRAELAHSNSRDPLRAAQATAWLTEVDHISDRLEAKAWARAEPAGFGAGQTLLADAGTRRAGAEARWKFDKHWSLESDLQFIDNLSSDAQRRAANAEVRYQADGGNLALGLRHVEDKVAATGDTRSDLLTSTGSKDFFDRKLTLRATLEQALGGRDSSVDYPSRVLLGADWHVRSNATLFTEWEHSDGANLSGDLTRIGVRAQPWERTQLTSSVNEQHTEFGPRRFANFGLTQGLQLDRHWSVDFGVDQSHSLLGAGATAQAQANLQPLAPGNLDENYFASFAGTQYHDEHWTFTSRLEHRTATSGDRWVFNSGWYREPSAGHALSWAALWQQDTPTTTAATSLTDLRFAYAWRPDGSDWMLLDRTELQRQRLSDFSTGANLTTGSETTSLIQNFHANWQIDARSQLGLQLGLRYAVTTLASEKFPGFATLLGADLRRDLPWRAFGRALDIGLHGATLASHQSGTSENSFGVDAGITLLPNLWVSLGYNWQGFRADGFASDRQTAQGVYLKFRFKADQDTFKDLRLDSLRPSR